MSGQESGTGQAELARGKAEEEEGDEGQHLWTPGTALPGKP